MKLYSKYFQKQKMMRTVLIACAPIILFGIYTFGLRTLALLIFNIVVASLVEYISEKSLYKKAKVTEAAIVTATLFTLTLPPALPFWISGIGVAFAIFFGKELFGGFGKNVFNPAIVGRVFLYINFPKHMTIFSEAINSKSLFNGLGGFIRWSTPTLDSITSPTPMSALKLNGKATDTINLIFGNISGAIGEISAVLIIIGAIYMIYKKIASWEIMIATVLGFVGSSYLFILLGASSVISPLEGIIVGGFLFGTVFMATDPISAPKTVEAKWIYGIIIGLVVVTIRSFTAFSGGMMFAILISSVFSPIIDYVFKERNKKKRLAKKGV